MSRRSKTWRIAARWRGHLAAAAFVAVCGCRAKDARVDERNGDAAGAGATDASVAAAPSTYVLSAQWGHGGRIYVQTTNAIYELDERGEHPRLRVAFDADIRGFDVAETKDLVVVVLQNGDVKLHSPNAPSRLVPSARAHGAWLSKNGERLVIARSDPDTRTETLFVDVESLAVRGRVATSAELVDPEGGIALTPESIVTTQGGTVLETIAGAYTTSQVLGARVAVFTERELVVFDAPKRATVRMPASCARKPDHAELGTDAFDARTRRAVRWCHDHVLVFDVSTLARTAIDIPNAPPRTQEGGFPWFGVTEVSFQRDNDAILLAGHGYDHELTLSVDAKKRTVNKLKKRPEPDVSDERHGLALDWTGGVLKTRERGGLERTAFGDPHARAPLRAKKPGRLPTSPSASAPEAAAPR